MLSKCATGETVVDRMIAVVAWCISTIRTPKFGVAPYNPILGCRDSKTNASGKAREGKEFQIFFGATRRLRGKAFIEFESITSPYHGVTLPLS